MLFFSLYRCKLLTYFPSLENFNISYKANLMATYSLNFYLFKKVFLSLSFLKNNFIRYRILCWWFLFSQHSKYFAAAAKSLQSCLTLCDPIDGSPPGSPVPGILQARTGVG